MSQGEWELRNRFGEESIVIEHGTLNNLNTGADDSNSVVLVVFGIRGLFYLNGSLISHLDLSDRPQGGELSAMTGAVTGHEIPGERTAYRDFAVWPLLGIPAETGCMVAGRSGNLRTGPGTQYAVDGTLNGDYLRVIGRATDGQNYTWWQVDSGRWVREDLVDEYGLCAYVQ
jgi:hypothetical protein